jgi:hypothetical protein
MGSPCDCGRPRRIGLEGIAQAAVLQSFNTTALQSSSKKPGCLIFSMRRHDEFAATHHQRHSKRKQHMRHVILTVALLCVSQTVFAQELTAEQRSACMGDFEKFCKGTTPGGGRIIACLAKSNDKLTPACKKILAEAEKK